MLRGRLGCRWLRRLRGSALALHVDAAAEVSALGDRHAWRDDVPVDRPVVADVDLVARCDVPGDLAEHDDRLGEHLRLDAAVRADRQHVVAQLNGAFDVAFDGQIFAAVQLALDDDRLPYVHDVLLHLTARLGTRTRSHRLRWRGRLRCSRRLPARRSNRFIAFPHVFPPPLSRGARGICRLSKPRSSPV